MSKAFIEAPEQEPRSGWGTVRERAPSWVQADEPRLARWFGTGGLFLLVVGLAALIFHLRIAPGTGVLGVVLGIAFLLFHAATDKDLQVRRTYGVFGFLWVAFAIIATFVPPSAGLPPGANFLRYGFPGMIVGLLFLMPFSRNETEARWRNAAIYLVGIAGVLMALAGCIGGNVSEKFLVPYGLLLGFLGFLYWWTFIGMEGAATSLGYRACVAMGIVGALVFLSALGRAALPELFFKWHWVSSRPDSYLVPSGLLLMALGLLYVGLSLALCWDNRFVVLTRRELATFFYSPIAYIVLFCMVVLGLWNYFNWAAQFVVASPFAEARNAFPEPIVAGYVIGWWTVIVLTIIVPLLTMSLLSEENRTGTLEVLLTAPVSESSVVLSKFLAAFLFFLLAFIPWALYLVAFRVEVGQPFEYRPLLTFFFALACTGAGFVAMGEFFSSITRSQMGAFILAFVGMLGFLGVFFLKFVVEQKSPGSPWADVLSHLSYVDLWIKAMDGLFVPSYLVLHVSAAIFWLFLTIKVLESRKWR
jgi:ABC-2 type transport system permease protein